jgi:hypothetical protein
MIVSSSHQEKPLNQSDIARGTHTGLNSVLAAAVVNQHFRDALLHNPEAALDQGYLGKRFSLSKQETYMILSVNASSLADLARQIISTFEK